MGPETRSRYLLDDGLQYDGLCLTCGGGVKVLNDGAVGLCRTCGRVSVDVQIRDGMFIEGFSKENWDEIRKNIASGYPSSPVDDEDDIPF